MTRPKQRDRRYVDVRIPNGEQFHNKFLRDLEVALFSEDRGFKSEYLLEEFLSKFSDPSLNPPSVRKSRAIEKWLAIERRNAETNKRLLIGDVDFGWTTSSELIGRVKSLISRILGPIKYDKIFTDLMHTNGASTRVKRSASAATCKLVGDAHISEDALKHWLHAATCENGRLSKQNLVFQENSVLFTVPKKSDIDRVACKEPEVNMLLQRAVGLFIRKRLRKVGIDLND